MARCQCGGGGCSCVVQAGDNTTVTGAGSPANPFVVNAVTNCAEVRACLSAGPGIDFDPSTGTISVDLSTTPGNNVIIDEDGLFVPAGGATVQTGCGLLGDGSASSPVQARTATWPHACGITASGGNVYCDTSSGALKTDPPFRARYRELGINDVVSPVRTVPDAETTIDTLSLSVVNPDPCRAAFAIVHRTVDVDFTLPAAGGAAASGINGDDVNYMKNSGSSIISSWHGQHTTQHNLTLAAGATTPITLGVTVGRGAGGATYNRIQATIRVWLFSIPLS
ncbi:hypothetical protein [[Kitasatospora] papulosa]|uniref:hypothetical protein n=1 Tax=[Kitasatospora] papulosa TaxID=1464011 RepID=UPI00368157B7